MKKIEETIMLKFTLDEVVELNKLIDRDTIKNGIADKNRDYNKCPVCDRLFGQWETFCPNCGQRIKFVDSDDIPL